MCAYTIVLAILRAKRDMDDVCQEIANRLSGRNFLFSSRFWLGDDAWKDVWTRKEPTATTVTIELADVIKMAYDLCNVIVKDYEKLCDKMLGLIYSRLSTTWEDDSSSEVDGCVSEFVQGEMYLRRLYLCLRSQGFLGEDGDAYVGSRQQCLYGCVCLVYLLFEVCGNFDFVKVDSVDWLMQTVFDGGCSGMVSSAALSLGEKQLMGMVGGSLKPIHACVFDLVNMKNPSGGMIGPGNCKWFHDLVLRLSGTVDRRYGKLIKNHAALHDAFGFLINRVNVGPGYTFGYYRQDVMKGSGSLWSRWCIMGQLSGLYAVQSLMKYIPDLPTSFTSFDFYNEKEQGYGRVAISQRLFQSEGKS